MQGEESFAIRLRRFRSERGMTIRDVAHVTDLAESTIYRFEASKTALPRADSLEALAQALGVTTDLLLGIDTFPAGAAPIGEMTLARLPLLKAPTASAPTEAEIIEWCEVPEMLLPAEIPVENLYLLQATGQLELKDTVKTGDILIAARGTELADGNIAIVMLYEPALRKVWLKDAGLFGIGQDGDLEQIAEDDVLARVVRVTREL